MSHSNNLEDPIWASLPVVKFSHLTCPTGRRCPAWTHVTASDLSFVVQAIRVVDELGSYGRRVVMKIFRSQEILESQDLGQVVQHYRQPASPTEPAGAVEVMTRGVSMAMRYPKTPDSMRKIQLRFQNDPDCAKASGIMRDLGLPINQVGGSQPLQPPRSAAPPTLYPPPSTESAGGVGLLQESRPAPALSSLSQLSQDRSYGMLSSSPHFDFKVPERPATCESRMDLSCFTGREAASDPASMATPKPHLLRTSFFGELKKPLYLSQMDREYQPRETSQLIPQDLSTGSMVTQSSSIYLRKIQVQGEENTDKARLSSSSPSFNPHLTSTRHPEPSLQDPSWISSQRPASTPADLEDLVIPPRRKLPFERPDPAIRSSSAISLPALPKPTPVSRTSPMKAGDNGKQPLSKAAPIKRVAQRKGPTTKPTASSSLIASPTIKRVTCETIIAPPQTREGDSSPLAAKSAAAAAATSRPDSVASGMVSKAQAPSNKRVTTPILPPSSNKRLKMTSKATQTENLISSCRNITGQDSAAHLDKVGELVPDVAAAASPPDTYLNDLDSYVAKYKERPASKEIWQTPDYADADAEHRKMVLDEFICENLESADFLQLCVDMETAWRKIGLGI
ncbi:hypothetical protein PZA11_006018 [Diplocarpon coronariae]|nr:hypothetical protein JHW43_002304 [Diplocarpon mali]